METSEKLNDDVADFRNSSSSIAPQPVEQPATPQGKAPHDEGRRNVSKWEALLAIGILLGFLGVLYFLLQPGSRPSKTNVPQYPLSPSMPPGQPK